MPELKNIRFQKYDKYGNIIFITNDKEVELYKGLKKRAKHLSTAYPDSFLPIYYSPVHKYVTLRCSRFNSIEMVNGGIYDLRYTVMSKNKDVKTYITCYIEDIKHVDTIQIDRGELVEFN
jgi:hypothetical protein